MWMKLILFLAISFAALLVRSAPTNYEPDELEVETRNAMDFHKFPALKWPGAKVPYVINPTAHYDSEQLEVIHWAMDLFHQKTCVHFVPRTDEFNYINITKKNGCYSHVGMMSYGVQTVSLATECRSPKAVLHELMHTIGFQHEAQRPDADQYITYILENIKPKYREEYAKDDRVPADDVDIEGQPYDYYSVMHFRYGAISHIAIDPKKPILIAKEGVKIEDIGKVKTLSELDIQEINKAYNCPSK